MLLDSAHDALPVYEYYHRQGIAMSIDLNVKCGVKLKYKDDFAIGRADGIPICMASLEMRHDGVEASKYRSKLRCSLMERRNKARSCSTPCSDAKWGRTVNLAVKDAPGSLTSRPRILRNDITPESPLNAATSA